MTVRTIKVDYLARVEGEGAFYVRIHNCQVEQVELRIFEPPRFFEAFLRGRSSLEAADITARICGICPVAYQMSAVQAVEAALAVSVSPSVRALRQLLYCGEWIASHALHIHMLQAPDFLGFVDAVAMAAQHRDALERGLALKTLGNHIMSLVGGRDIHPINVCVGGFFRAPQLAELRSLVEPLKQAKDQALASLRWVQTFEYPDFVCSAELLALKHRQEYPILDGELYTSGGLQIPVDTFEDQLIEGHVPYSTALHCVLPGGGVYLTGPLARFFHNRERLCPDATEAAELAQLGVKECNPYKSIIIRCVEIIHACDVALKMISEYTPPPARPKLGVMQLDSVKIGRSYTEAPRGVLYHRYSIDQRAEILEAKIVPPTSQNQGAIEADLRTLVGHHLEADDATLRALCEKAIRNYDPCISCASHFLDLRVERGDGVM